MIYAFSIPICKCIKSYPPVTVHYMRSTDEEDEEEEEEVSFLKLLSPSSRDHTHSFRSPFFAKGDICWQWWLCRRLLAAVLTSKCFGMIRACMARYDTA